MPRSLSSRSRWSSPRSGLACCTAAMLSTSPRAASAAGDRLTTERPGMLYTTSGRLVAAATSLPLVVYNIPGRSVVNLSPEALAALGEVDNIVAVKQANPDLG